MDGINGKFLKMIVFCENVEHNIKIKDEYPKLVTDVIFDGLIIAIEKLIVSYDKQ